MDPDNPIVQILQTINDLSGEALKALTQAGGGGGAEGGAPVEEGGEVPAPPA